jgi:glycosyltransferase involved in cell wall biosynthesis
MISSDVTHRVSLIVTVRNERAGIMTLLEALAGQTRQPDEIVIVDGGSTDGTWEALACVEKSRVPVRLVRRPDANISEGRNEAVRHARHEIIACTDAGCIPDANWLEELIKPFEDLRIAVVGGAYRIMARTRFERVCGLLALPGQLTDINPARFNPSARSLAFRREAWSRAGGFPTWLYTAEDTLFACKLRQLGIGFAFAGGAVVRWRPRSGWRKLWQQFAGYARGEGHLARGAGASLFWLRRYCLALTLLATASMCWAFTGAAGTLIVGFAGATALLGGPLHRTAAQIARRNNAPLDYPLALVVGHVIAMAGIAGLRRGLADREQDPQRYVLRLVEYWGSIAVTDVPPWRMAEIRAPRTMVVAWHCPPANRASSAVLGNLLAAAPAGSIRVLTRALPAGADPLPIPALCTTRVAWPLPSDEDLGWRTWVASLRTVVRMVRAGMRAQTAWPAQHILAVYPHRFSILAGWLLARITGLPLHAYMHDLCQETLITRSRLKRRFWQALDRRVVRHAASIIVPTQDFAQHYQRRGARRVMVLPHVCTAAPESPLPPPSNKLRVLYAGSVYQAHLDALAAFDRVARTRGDVEVTYLTNANAVLSADRVAWVTRAETQAYVQTADVFLVLLGEQTPYPDEIRGCFPSKIVEALALGRPILAVVPQDSFVARFVRESGCGVVAQSFAEDAIHAALDALHDPAARIPMAAAARSAAAQLSPSTWIQRLQVHLAGSRELAPVEAPRQPQNPGAAAQNLPVLAGAAS